MSTSQWCARSSGHHSLPQTPSQHLSTFSAPLEKIWCGGAALSPLQRSVSLFQISFIFFFNRHEFTIHRHLFSNSTLIKWFSLKSNGTQMFVEQIIENRGGGKQIIWKTLNFSHWITTTPNETIFIFHNIWQKERNIWRKSSKDNISILDNVFKCSQLLVFLYFSLMWRIDWKTFVIWFHWRIYWINHNEDRWCWSSRILCSFTLSHQMMIFPIHVLSSEMMFSMRINFIYEQFRRTTNHLMMCHLLCFRISSHFNGLNKNVVISLWHCRVKNWNCWKHLISTDCHHLH